MTVDGSDGALNWIGDRLTATDTCCGPFRGFRAGGSEHPFADLVDEPDFLGERDEQRRADRPLLRMVPADQRLEPGHRLARSVDAGLEDDPQLALLERNAQVRFHQLPLARRLVHFGSEEAEAALARRLGGVERKVGVAHQVVGGAIVIVGRDDADGRADRNGGSVDRVGPRKAVDDALRQLRQLVLVAEVAGSTTSNSSPPRRPTCPASPITSRSRRETSRSSVSPAGWPSVSFTALKRSRSRRKTEQRCLRRTAPTSASSSARRRASRLARPVSESCRASRSSSTSDCRILVRSDAKPRKPKKRPTSS